MKWARCAPLTDRAAFDRITRHGALGLLLLCLVAPWSGREGHAQAPAGQDRAIEQAFEAVAEAWVAGDFDTVRALCSRILGDDGQPPHVRGHAHLRLAQSHRAEGDDAAARREYARIAAAADYPPLYRREARELTNEVDRIAEGLPPRDVEATRPRLQPIEDFAAEVHVGPEGDDGHDGSRLRPFATFTRARDEVRSLRARGVDGPILVRILEGTYPVRETALSLTEEDSGREGAPTVWRAERPGAAILYGGARLGGFTRVDDPEALQRIPEQAHGQVRQTDVRAQGIGDLGELSVRGFGQPTPPATVELFFNGRPMTLARWPNRGMVGVRRVIERGSRAEDRPSVFVYESDRHARWVDAPDGWIFGYFLFLWADGTLPIGKIDPEARTLTTAEPYHYGGRGMETQRQPIRYYAFNLLEELDVPGEWYLDRERGILYLIPPGELEQAAIEMGLLNGPMITLDGVSDVHLEGLVLDLGRADGLVARDSSRITIAGCTVKRMAGTGISMHGGEDNMVLGCDIYSLGRRGIEMIGGDRSTLTPGNHTVANCWIHHFGRIDRTYVPAIQLEGVGNRVAHNRMSHGPSSAMRIEGNDHIVEFNDFHDLVTESDDQGAIDMWGNPTYRNVLFRHNRFRDIGKTDDEPTVHGQAAIRFDDTISGMTVHGNLFVRSSHGNFGAVQIHAGRDNIIDGNIFIDCTHGVTGGWNAHNHHWRRARSDNPPAEFITSELYRSRYPRIETMFDEPGINHVWRNLFVRCRHLTHRGRHLDMFGNISADDGGFVDADDGDYRFEPHSPAVTHLGLRPLPLDAVGPYEDAHRASWPVGEREEAGGAGGDPVQGD